MENQTLWEKFQARNFSRRSFVKTCMAITAALGLPATMMPEVAKAAETKELPVVIWLHGHECTGCDESFIRSSAPFASDVVLNMVSVEINEVLSASAGHNYEEHLAETIKKYHGKYILAVEGGVPTHDSGNSCMINGRPFIDELKEAAEGAMAIIEYGSCAAWGGIQAAYPNPTQTKSVSDVISGKPIIKVPGCPPIPEVMTSVVMHVALFGEIPPLDSVGRPLQFYGNRIHDTCYRRPFFDSGLFVNKFDDAGAKAGWCLYRVGCRGPVAYSSCGNLRWWKGLSYPIQSGHGCIGCTEKGFWDNDNFYQRLPQIHVPNTITDADKVLAVATGVTGAAVVVHGAITAAVKARGEAKHKVEEAEEE